MNETIEAMARAMVEAKVFSATGGCDGGAGPRHGVLGRRRQPGRQGGCGGGCRGESGSGSEGGGGGEGGGGEGGGEGGGGDGSGGDGGELGGGPCIAREAKH